MSDDATTPARTAVKSSPVSSVEYQKARQRKKLKDMQITFLLAGLALLAVHVVVGMIFYFIKPDIIMDNTVSPPVIKWSQLAFYTILIALPVGLGLGILIYYMRTYG